MTSTFLGSGGIPPYSCGIMVSASSLRRRDQEPASTVGPQSTAPLSAPVEPHTSAAVTTQTMSTDLDAATKPFPTATTWTIW